MAVMIPFCCLSVSSMNQERCFYLTSRVAEDTFSNGSEQKEGKKIVCRDREERVSLDGGCTM